MGFVLQLSHASTVKVPPFGRAPARLLRLLRARLVALGGSALPGGEANPLGAQPVPRVLELPPQSSQDHRRGPPRHAGEDPEGWSAQERHMALTLALTIALTLALTLTLTQAELLCTLRAEVTQSGEEP